MTTDAPSIPSRALAGVALVSGTLLMIELALTRIFSVVMYYHFAFLAISIALFGLSASGVFVYLRRHELDRRDIEALLARQSLVFAVCTIVALFVLVRLRVGLNYSPRNLALMLTIYALSALPFFTGGLVITLAISRLAAGNEASPSSEASTLPVSSRRSFVTVNAVYAADLLGAAAGCLVLIPLLDRLGAPGVVLTAAAIASLAATLFAAKASRARTAMAGAAIVAAALAAQWSGIAGFDITSTKGHEGDRVLFSKWNSFSRIGVYERAHGDWSLSPSYKGPLPETRFMDIDSAASTPILRVAPDLSNAQYLRYELTSLVYHLYSRDWGLGILDSDRAERQSNPEPQAPNPGFTALVIGPGGGRDLVSALVFGARQVDAVEINPIIANDVMRGRFREFSGGIYTNPRVRIVVDDGRSFVRRTGDRYDVIQASLVDTWAATAAGAYTLTENTLYTVEAFDDYLDHLNDEGMLAITRWVMDGLRLVSLAQAAVEARGWDATSRIAIVQAGRVATFLLKKSPFTREEVARLRAIADSLQFDVLYVPFDEVALPEPDDLAPAHRGEEAPGASQDGTRPGDYARLIQTPDRERFYREFRQDIRPTTDDRPFFFHTTKLEDQFQVAFGRSMLFGNGLSALLTLLGISFSLVALFVVGPLILSRRADGDLPSGWLGWLVCFGALGAGFMLIEVSVLQRFVLLLGHPVYSLTVTLFSLLLGTGIGAALSRHLREDRLRRSGAISFLVIATLGMVVIAAVSPFIGWAIPFARPARIAIAIAALVPIGILLGIPMPTALRVLSSRAPQMLAWAWGINGALSVVGATLAIFVAMNWGFRTTLLSASATYLVGLCGFLIATKARPN